MTRNLSLKPSGISIRQFLLPLLIILAFAIAVGSIFWIFAHPYGLSWDEAGYINRAYRDFYKFKQGGAGELMRVLFKEDTARPPALRVLTLPITAIFGVNTALLRGIALVYFWIALAVLYGAGRQLAGSATGAMAAIAVLISPIVVKTSRWFGTEFPLLLSVAGMLYFLFADGNRDRPRPWHWVGLGIALALGSLSKASFAFIAAPMMLLAAFLSWRKIIGLPKVLDLVKASGLAIAIIAPWWLMNVRAVAGYVKHSGNFVRHSLGPRGSPETLMKWFNAIGQTVLGLPLTALAIAIILFALLQLKRKQIQIETAQLAAIAVCLAGVFPFWILSAFSTNNNPRFLAPTLLPLALALALLAVASGWTASRWLMFGTVAIFCLQTAIMLSPSPGDPRYQRGDAAGQTLHWGNITNAMQRSEQWDWSALKQLCQAQNLEYPSIAYLGQAYNLNPESVQLPWMKEEGRGPRVQPLWSFGEGDFHWSEVLQKAKSRDLILVAPDLVGDPVDKHPLDNQYNAEFVRLLRSDPQFTELASLPMGRFEPVQLLVFRNLAPR